jgi:signal transduction histidine kinase
MGLGVSLSYDIVTQGHGGTFELVDPEYKGGTTFLITLPVGDQSE